MRKWLDGWGGCLIMLLVVGAVVYGIVYWRSYEIRKTVEAYAAFKPIRQEIVSSPICDRLGVITAYWVKYNDEQGRPRLGIYQPVYDPRIPYRVLCSSDYRIATDIFQDVGGDQERYLLIRAPMRSERTWEKSPTTTGSMTYPRIVVEVHLHAGEVPQSNPGQRPSGKFKVED